MTASHVWQEAAAFSARAHRHQFRRDKQTPYASNPVRVALTIACVFGITDETILAAALLHDVIEDCDVDYDDIHERFGVEVADLVACLTKDMRLIESEREKAYDTQLAAGSWQARLIKLADVYDNLSDAADESSKRSMIDRAKRAVSLADGCPELVPASSMLVNLVENVELALNSNG